MSVLPLVTFPNPLLKQVSKPVEKITPEIQKLMDDMLQTMYQEGGVGLAAVQVGVLKRILVIDVSYTTDGNCGDHHCGEVHVKNTKPIFMVNPQILEQSKENYIFNEGCLSFPGARAEVERPKDVVIKYLDYYGEEKILASKDSASLKKYRNSEVDNLLAVCVQHEIDHLNGVTFVDHISKLKREIILKKLKKNK